MTVINEVYKKLILKIFYVTFKKEALMFTRKTLIVIGTLVLTLNLNTTVHAYTTAQVNACKNKYEREITTYKTLHQVGIARTKKDSRSYYDSWAKLVQSWRAYAFKECSGDGVASVRLEDFLTSRFSNL